MNYRDEINKRVQNRQQRSLLDVNTFLEHFAIISYKVPINRIRHLLPRPFKFWTYKKDGIEYALISAVPFKDKDFSFYRISKYPRFQFFQTNFRTYVIDERTNMPCAWFFATTLGSITSLIPKKIWKMPWEYGRYEFEYSFNGKEYDKYLLNFRSKQGNGIINIRNTGNEMKILEGFDSIEQQTLILTHPVVGYYHVSDTELGTYEIWHPEMELKEGQSIELYIELFEKLGLLSKEEMNQPHSVLITPEIEFDILLPPRKESIVKLYS